MNKKVAIFITVAVVALAYLFLLVFLPMLVKAMSCDFETPSLPKTQSTAMYFAPGVLGAIVIVLVIMQKKEAKGDE